MRIQLDRATSLVYRIDVLAATMVQLFTFGSSASVRLEFSGLDYTREHQYGKRHEKGGQSVWDHRNQTMPASCGCAFDCKLQGGRGRLQGRTLCEISHSAPTALDCTADLRDQTMAMPIEYAEIQQIDSR